MTIKNDLLIALNDAGPMKYAQIVEYSPELSKKNIQARLWELRRDGKVEHAEDGTYTALAEPDVPKPVAIVATNGATPDGGSAKAPKRSSGDVKGPQAAAELDEPLSGDEAEFQKLLKDMDVKKGINVITRTVFRGDPYDLDHVTDVLMDAKAFVNPGPRKMILRYWSDYTEQDLTERLIARLDRTEGARADDDKDAAVDELGIGWGIEKDRDGEWGPSAGGEMTQVQAVKAAAQMNVTRGRGRPRDDDGGDGGGRRAEPFGVEQVLAIIDRLKPDKGDTDEKLQRLEERLEDQREALAAEREGRLTDKLGEMAQQITSLANRDPVTAYQKAKETVYAFEGDRQPMVTDSSPTVQLAKDVGDKVDKNMNRVVGLLEQVLLRNQGEYSPEHASTPEAQEDRAERLGDRMTQTARSEALGRDLFGTQS